MPKRTKDYHSWLLKRLSDPIEAARYLKIAKEDSQEAFLNALRNVAESHGMAKVAEGAGVTREGLYPTLSQEGNPRLSTLDSVLDVLGLELTVQLKKTHTGSAEPPRTDTDTTILANGGVFGIFPQVKGDTPKNYFVNLGTMKTAEFVY